MAIPNPPTIVARNLLESCSRGMIGSGAMEAFRVADGFLATVHHRHFDDAFTAVARVDGWISIHFRLTGVSTHVFGDIGQVRRGGHSCMLVAYPEGVLNCEYFDPGTSLRSVGFALDPDYVVQELGLGPSDLPDILGRWLDGDRSAFFHADIPFTGDMHQAVADMINCPYSGLVRYRYSQARALQLLCMVMDALVRRRRQDGADIRLTSRERQRLQEICEILSERFEDDLTIAELAKLAGMNRTKLQYGFRHMFGATINEFRSEARMTRAHELLRNGDLSIGQVAHAVGYDHANNFTAAFKRRFGFLPRDNRPSRRVSAPKKAGAIPL